jgi:hypothetical protein
MVHRMSGDLNVEKARGSDDIVRFTHEASRWGEMELYSVPTMGNSIVTDISNTIWTFVH